MTAELCRRLMKNYPTIKPENIISHKEACARGYASNHADCDHWLAKFGRDMDWFRGLVRGEKMVRICASKLVSSSAAADEAARLRALGYTVEQQET